MIDQIEYSGPTTPTVAVRPNWRKGCLLAAISWACIGTVVICVLSQLFQVWRDGEFPNSAENKAEAQRWFNQLGLSCQMMEKAMVPGRDPSCFFHVKGDWRKLDDLCSLLSAGQKVDAAQFRVSHDIAEDRLPHGSTTPSWWDPTQLRNPRGCFIDNGRWVWVIMGEKQGEAFIAIESH